jgi:FMN phosphatase YigB (HAD superfamily)
LSRRSASNTTTNPPASVKLERIRRKEIHLKILYYVNPFVVRGDLGFYSGALRKKLIPQARLLQEQGHEVSFVTGEFDAPLIQHDLPNSSVHAVTQRELKDIVGSTRNIEAALYTAAESAVAGRYRALIAEKVPHAPDVVFVWETPGSFLSQVFPAARLVHQMPGFLSRVPFPELYALDPNGLFNESSISRHERTIKQWPLDPRAERLLALIRSELLTFIAARTPYQRGTLDPSGNFRRLMLLPLQVSDQYAFKADAGYDSQMALLLDVLSQLPSDVGLVVTQYATASTSETVLNKESYVQLKAVYPNLIYDPKFDLLDNISQYLLPSVDAVVTVSSSIGVQALLWKKPLVVLGNSHLRPFATFDSVVTYVDAVEAGCDGCHDADGLLGWVLSYLQPAATLLLSDPSFLSNWLEHLCKGNGDIAAMPSFFDLIEDYELVFLAQAKKERAGALLRSAYQERGENKLDADFELTVSNLKPELISFDIFDTLLDRSVEQPVHAFKMIEAEVDRITSGRIANFATARPATERLLRERVAAAGQTQEVTLSQIYDEFAERYGLSESTKDAVCALELAEELRTLRRRDAGFRLFDIARRSTKRVVLISDMYLPEPFVKRCLANAGYPDDVPLYLSSTIGLRKHEGDLFAFVQSTEGVRYDQWLHVGDNPHGDKAVPGQLGIHTNLVKSAFQLLSSNRKLGALVQADKKSRTKAEAAIYGLVQRRFFDDPHRVFPADTHFGGDAFQLGYVGAGPLFFGFLQWVMCSARNDGIDHLLFLSRDGKVLWRMAQVLFPASEGWPRISYALSSRRAARVASIFSSGDISQLADSSISTTTLSDLFFKKFGIELIDDDREMLRSCGFSDRDARVGSMDREQVRTLALALSPRILANAEAERGHLRDYYRGLGVQEGRRVAVVDIGYAATMQVAIERITGASSVAGYYYISFESALENVHRTGRIKGYAGDFVKPQIHSDVICRNGFLFETLFCSSDASFICLRQDSTGKVLPRFDVAEKDGARRHMVDRVHEGAMALAHDLRAAHGDRVDELPLSAATASRVLANFIVSPGGRDAEIFEGTLFDDSFAGSSPRYIVPPRRAIQRDPKCVARAVWSEGASVFARRSDLFGNGLKPAKAKPTSSALESPRPYRTPPRLQSIFSGLERRIVTRLVRGKKQAKYLKDRALFFMDTRALPVRLYWQTFGRHI